MSFEEKGNCRNQSMKEDIDFVPVGCIRMAGVTRVSGSFPTQHPFPTPSPFSFSAASTRSSRPSIHVCNLLLRFMAFLLSFLSAISLAAPPPKGSSHATSGFTKYPELMYCFVVTIVAFVYSAFQLFKSVCDFTHRGIVISDLISDYISFIFDQLVGYLLVSSSSVAVPAIRQIKETASFEKAAIITVSASFATFLLLATCALFSGYKLCKRIVW